MVNGEMATTHALRVYGKFLSEKQAKIISEDDPYFHFGKDRKRPNKYKVSPRDWDAIQAKLSKQSLFEKTNMEPNFLFRGIPVVVGMYVKAGNIRRVWK